MRSLCISVKPPIFSIRHFIAIMSSQALGLQGSCSLDLEYQKGESRCHCNEASLRTMSHCSTKSDHGKTSEESKNHRPRQELQWKMLSEDEKNIYFQHKTACMNGKNTYVDPVTGYTVFTEEFLRKRRTCCGNGCRHCPYGHENVPEGRKKKFNSAFYV